MLPRLGSQSALQSGCVSPQCRFEAYTNALNKNRSYAKSATHSEAAPDKLKLYMQRNSYPVPDVEFRKFRLHGLLCVPMIGLYSLYIFKLSTGIISLQSLV